MARQHELGDGDACPVAPDHGRMFTIRGSNPPKQQCPDQSHDGDPKSSGRETSRTRAVWPLGPDSFKSAVEGYFTQAQPPAANMPAPVESDGIDLSALLEV